MCQDEGYGGIYCSLKSCYFIVDVHYGENRLPEALDAVEEEGMEGC